MPCWCQKCTSLTDHPDKRVKKGEKNSGTFMFTDKCDCVMRVCAWPVQSDESQRKTLKGKMGINLNKVNT